MIGCLVQGRNEEKGRRETVIMEKMGVLCRKRKAVVLKINGRENKIKIVIVKREDNGEK